MFIAKLIASDGFMDQKQFSTSEGALSWLRGDGPKKFDGDVERAELWSGTDLLWSKDERAKSKYDTQSWNSSHLRQHAEYKAFEKERREFGRTSPVRKAKKRSW